MTTPVINDIGQVSKPGEKLKLETMKVDLLLGMDA